MTIRIRPLTPKDASTYRELRLRALVGTADGTTVLTAEDTGEPGEADALGQRVARSLIDQGAKRILDEVYARD